MIWGKAYLYCPKKETHNRYFAFFVWLNIPNYFFLCTSCLSMHMNSDGSCIEQVYDLFFSCFFPVSVHSQSFSVSTPKKVDFLHVSLFLIRPYGKPCFILVKSLVHGMHKGFHWDKAWLSKWPHKKQEYMQKINLFWGAHRKKLTVYRNCKKTRKEQVIDLLYTWSIAVHVHAQTTYAQGEIVWHI